MRRLRFLFAVFAIGLFGPIVFLVARVLNGLEVERDMRHRAVAERIFDENERSLSGFLEAEERLPIAGYTDATHAGEHRFVVGYFEIAPHGDVSVAPNAASDAPKAPAEMAAVLRRFGPEQRGDIPLADAPTQMPGTTVALDQRGRAQGVAAEPQAEGRAGAESAFDTLRSLNRAASERLQKQRAAEVYDKKAEVAQPQAGAASMAESDGHPSLPEPVRQETEVATAQIPPMVGQLLAPDQIVLYRTVIRSSQAYRQGMLIDVPSLCRWLQAQTLPGFSGTASLTCSNTRDAMAPSAAPFTYQHRFADPFDSVTARLGLRLLSGARGVVLVYALCAFLLFTGSLGLFALYRMVAVTVRYAEQRSNFVAAVSHELKTPLTAIRMYGEMLRDGIVPSDSKRQEYYRHITGEAERLSRLIGNVLELARIEKGTRSMNLAKADAGAIVREVGELLRPHLEAEGFELAVSLEPGLPLVTVERDALVQVLANLIDNASKYARDASDKRIEVRCERDERGVRLTVRDHGPGVAPRHLGRIFEPFYRGEDELTRRHKGTGIGLALVRGLVSEMGATVTAQNHPEGGLEVTIRPHP